MFIFYVDCNILLKAIKSNLFGVKVVYKVNNGQLSSSYPSGHQHGTGRLFYQIDVCEISFGIFTKIWQHVPHIKTGQK
jgi:hypothetical protein